MKNVVKHDNIHIPTESFPHWIWFVIEFAIVLAVSAILSKEATGAIEGLDEVMQNWVFMGILTSIFGGWYIIIRGFILKKPILSGR
jgi:hypothetical protein